MSFRSARRSTSIWFSARGEHRMPRVEVNRIACTGCAVCVETCPPDVLRMDKENKAVVAYPDDCQGCFVCQWDCKFEALRVRLS
ncbi:MAG: ferredoxin family protein [Alphaproteobacteria bacterium]